jgi:hypothetical protein
MLSSLQKKKNCGNHKLITILIIYQLGSKLVKLLNLCVLV